MSADFLELEAILLDVDGTIVDPRTALKEVWKRSLQKMGLPPLDDDTIESSMGEVVTTTFPRLFPQHSNRANEFLSKFITVYPTIPCEYFTPIEGATNAINELSYMGFKLGIVANKEGTIIRHVLECLGLSNIFPGESIVCLDDGYKPKPSGEPVSAAVKKLGVSKQYTGMAGDHVYDVISGKEAGVRTIAVLSGTSKKQEFEQYTPDLIIPSISEIPRYVRKRA